MTTSYVLKINGDRFIGEDYVSGGYPYECDVYSAKRFEQPHEPLEWLGSMKDSWPTVRTVKLDYVITEIDEKDMTESFRKSGLAKPTEYEQIALGLQ